MNGFERNAPGRAGDAEDIVWRSALDRLSLAAWAVSLGPSTPGASERARPARSPAVWRWAAGAALAASTLAAAWSSVGSLAAPNDAPAYVAAPDTPSVGVYVNREGRVFLWNGVDAVRPGDRIRLGIASGGYRHVAVSSRYATGLVTLYRGELGARSQLPVAWAVDADGDAERLVVVLSQRPLSDSELADRERGKLAADVWARDVVLPKSGGGRR